MEKLAWACGGAALILSLFSTPAGAGAAQNGAGATGTVTAVISNAAICSDTECNVNGEIIQPTLISDADGITYVY